MSELATCFYCKKERSVDQMAMKVIVHRVFDHVRQKQKVVSEEMGPFCLAKYQDKHPPCGECYQMSCEG